MSSKACAVDGLATAHCIYVDEHVYNINIIYIFYLIGLLLNRIYI